ncbi:hypothetical protein CLF_107055 [Clonorchis sinensis]|uniref:Uncharacterized protein n=1 Tax=Clonorchis sinensis TaxID=79923 RepID=G7YQD8_CLOSI|nr:hypothetical protein CLF_107055 [Clonorchis sinensis]
MASVNRGETRRSFYRTTNQTCLLRPWKSLLRSHHSWSVDKAKPVSKVLPDKASAMKEHLKRRCRSKHRHKTSSANLRKNLFESISRQKLSYHQTNPTNELSGYASKINSN